MRNDEASISLQDKTCTYEHFGTLEYIALKDGVVDDEMNVRCFRKDDSVVRYLRSDAGSIVLENTIIKHNLLRLRGTLHPSLVVVLF
jgi:hypothetical protein